MQLPVSWLRELVHLPVEITGREIGERLTAAGVRVEFVHPIGEEIRNVVTARVLEIEDLTDFKKPVRWVLLTDGTDERHVICGAQNFSVGDVVAYARPPAQLPGMIVEARTTYDHVSDGMLCAADELGIGDDHGGLWLLDKDLELGADVVAVLGLRDEVLEFSINPDRGYALSARGIAREVAIAFNLPIVDPAAGIVVPALDSSAGFPVRVDDVAGCDRYVARAVIGVDPSATTPGWMQRRLTLAGMRPRSLAVDVTNYVMLELGQPLHAFDRSVLTAPIVLRRATAGERLRTLDDVDRSLDAADLLIADASRPLALAGVMGGEDSEISTDTTDVVIEAAHFEAVSVALTSRRHRIASEAARRFERGVDPDLPAIAAQRAVDLLVEYGGGTAEPAVTDIASRQSRTSIELTAGLPGRVSGVAYESGRPAALLRAIGCDVKEVGEKLTVTPPGWRADLRIAADLVEEVVRLAGYDQIPETVPHAPAGRGLSRRRRSLRAVADLLAATGWLEVVSYPFVAEDLGQRLGLLSDDPRVPTVKLASPVSETEPMMRSTLLPGLFGAMRRNVSRGNLDCSLFETGTVFLAGSAAGTIPVMPAGVRPTAGQLAALESALPMQPMHIAGVVGGAWEQAGWWGPGREVNWADAVQAAEQICRRLGVPPTRLAADCAPWHPGRCAVILADGAAIGWAGELHPNVVAQWRLPGRSVAFELNLESLLTEDQPPIPPPVVSPFPVASVDLALIVDASVTAADLTSAVRDGAGDLLESVRLFDVYRGDPIPTGQVSYAFALRFRAADRTLTAEAVNAARDAAAAVANARLGAIART